VKQTPFPHMNLTRGELTYSNHTGGDPDRIQVRKP